MYSLFVGVDVSKDSFSAEGLDPKGNTRFSMSANMDSHGFSELLKAVSSNCKKLPSAVVAMESTGCYHINLFSFLTSKGAETVILNPLLISNFAKLSLRKTKTDKKDAATIARFLLVHKDSVSQIHITQDLRDLRDIARERESLSGLIASTKNEIKRVLQSTFPELESMCNVFTKTMLGFLMEFPSARAVKAARPKDIADAFSRTGRGRRPSISPKELIRAAKSSVASISPAKELILHEKISTLLHLMERLDRITKALRELCESAAIEDLEILTSVDGIDTTTGATFLAETGDIDNFDSHRGLIAFAGLDPTVYQSGKFEGTSRLSKRGNRHLRRVIYLMTVSVIRFNNHFRAYFLKRRNDGLPYRRAVIATSHKLVRTIFSMLSHKSKFQENSL